MKRKTDSYMAFLFSEVSKADQNSNHCLINLEINYEIQVHSGLKLSSFSETQKNFIKQVPV